MGKSAETLKARLIELINSGSIKKIDLHRKAGIARNSIDGYLEGAIPDLDTLDKIAEALQTHGWDLIKPLDEPFSLPHDINDCLEAVTHAVHDNPNYFKPIDLSNLPNFEISEQEMFEHELSELPEKKRKSLIKQWLAEIDSVRGTIKQISKKTKN